MQLTSVLSNKIANCTSCHDEHSIFDDLCYVIDRNSAYLMAQNPQIGSKTLKSLYTLRFTIFYVTVHVRVDRPYVTVHTSIF